MGMTVGIGRTHTAIVREGSATEVIYHGTKVVVFDEDTITLNTGGYKSKTTKQRMNETSDTFSLGFTVNQIKGKWIVGYKGQDTEMDGDRLILNRKSGVMGLNALTYKEAINSVNLVYSRLNDDIDLIDTIMDRAFDEIAGVNSVNHGMDYTFTVEVQDQEDIERADRMIRALLADCRGQ